MAPLMFIIGLLCVVKITDCYIVPKLLLPYYDQVQVNYTINAEEGCYKWRSLNPTVASIQPILDSDNDECSTSAIVFVESTVPSRKITLILAESDHTGTVFQCDVIIDKIVSIDIISRTRELYLEDPPENLKIRALDSEGNTFSSTAGMLFGWSLVHDTEASELGDRAVMPAHSILSIERFIDTMYKAEDYVEKMEKNGQQSDTILLSGLQTGTAFVAVQLVSFVDVYSARIRFTVRDKVFLNPNGDVWLSQFAMVRYIVEQWRNGKSTEIKMPNQQYILQLSDSTSENPVVTLDQETSIVVAHRVGHNRLSLMDKNLKQETVQASSDIHVVEPAYLKLSNEPNDRWVLETGRHYIIHVNMYDSENHKLWPARNVRITTDMDSHHFEILNSSTNGTWHSVIAVKKGQVELYAKLNGIMKQNNEMKQYDPVIDTKQLADIYDPITVIPPIVVFPWQSQPVLYKYQLFAEGGSGNYTWSVEPNVLAMVSNVGMVMTKTNIDRIKANQTGSAVVRATDLRNPAHWGTSQIMVLPAFEILFAQSRREAEIGTYLDLYITMHARVENDMVPVVDCRDSGVVWNIQDSSTFEDLVDFKVPIHDAYDVKACMGRRFKALHEGHTTIFASYIQNRLDGTSVKLEASVTVAAFPTLNALDPLQLAVVTLDSSSILRFHGGPNRWPHWHAGYERKVESSDSEILEISSVQSVQHEHHVMSHCLRLGEAKVKLTVHNKPCNTNPLPVQVTVVVRVSCAVPSRIDLNIPPMLDSCPLQNTHGVQTVALMNRQLPVNVTAFDVYGHMFDNFTSIFIQWSSNTDETIFGASESLFYPVDASEQKKHIVNQEVSLPNIEGEQTLNVALTRYKESTAREICLVHDCTSLDPVVSGTLGILVVTEPTISPSQLVLYNHVNSTAEIQIFGGSGYFYHKLTQERNSTIVTKAKHNTLKIAAVHAGKSQLQVIDHCLEPTAVANADVMVTEVGAIHLEAPPRMELRTWSTATMKILDNGERTIPTRFLSFINIHLTSSISDIVIVEDVHATSGDNLVVLSGLTAQNVGTTTLTAVASLRNGHIITSNSVRIVIFPVLELLPPIVTLIPRASYQLTLRGGPRSDFTIEYLISNQSETSPIASVSQSGIVHALALGDISVSARAKMHDGTIFYCKAPSQVRVVRLAGIHIVAPLTQFHVGGTVPLHVAGVADDEQNPVGFGSAVPGLLFHWKIMNPSVVALHTVHAKAAIETNSSLSFTMLAEGISSGHSVISVTISAQDESLLQLDHSQLYAEVTLMAFEPPTVTTIIDKEWNSRNNFLMATSTSHHLQTNRDGVAADVEYKVLCGGNGKEHINMCCSVDRNGVITSFESQCEATVLITASERFDINQTLAIHVLVRPVLYIIARSVTNFRLRDSSSVAYAFPLHSTVRFIVDQFDDCGDKFDAASHSVVLDQNRHDLIEVEPYLGNRSFKVRTPQVGTTILSVASYLTPVAKPSAVYYFPITVLPSISPSKQELIIGSKFCFDSDFINQDGSNGIWSTYDSKNLLIDKRTGAVIAIAKAATAVTYTVDSFSASAQVTAKPFVATFVYTDIPKYITLQKKDWILPILLSNQLEAQSNCGGLKEELGFLAEKLFYCSVHFKHSPERVYFDAEVRYVAGIDAFACVLNAKENVQEDLNKIATIDDAIVVNLKAQSREFGLVEDGWAVISFIPFFVSELSSEKLVYGSHVTLCISTNQNVYETIQVTPTDSTLLAVVEESSNIPSNYCFRLSARSRDFTPQTTSISVSSRLTGQDELIELKMERSDGLLSGSSSCASLEHGSRRVQSDLIDSYLAYITTAAVVVISTAMLIAAFSFFKWVTSNTVHPPSSSFLSRTPPPYDASPSHLSSPTRQTPGSSPRVKLWSRFYEPQQVGPRSG